MFTKTLGLSDLFSRCRLNAAFYRITVLALCTLTSPHIYSSELSPFTSDGCSAFPDGTIKQNTLWLNCCRAHDLAYWKGGTYKQRVDADNELKACVGKAGEPHIGIIMLVGVRVGGTPFFPTTFRWGYGWKYPRVYGELTAHELEQIKKASPSYSSSPDTTSPFLPE